MKDSERLRKSDGIDDLDIVGMDFNTPIPVMPERFWTSEKIKAETQLVFHGTPINLNRNIQMIFSLMIYEGELLAAKNDSGDIPELNNWLEEADSKVIVHVEYAVRVQQDQFPI